jgi:hypothetical protein
MAHTIDRLGRKHAAAQYTATLQTPVEATVAERIYAEADALGISRAEVTRTYIQAGMDHADALEGDGDE